MRHSTKMLWGCVALVVVVAVAVALPVTGAKVAYGLFALPCMLMMGAMLWMMVRGMGGRSGGSGKRS